MKVPYQCKKCLRHVDRHKIVKIDPKTKKKWLILTCPDCDYESDIEEFKRPNRNSSSSYFYPAPGESPDEDRDEDAD